MELKNFIHAENTVVLSDIHLADAEPPHLHHLLWKEFKKPKHFIDASFKAFLEYLQQRVSTPIELVLNGDIFDFDSVMEFPLDPPFRLSWLERVRGLSSEEEKSRFKIKVIMSAHPIWVQALKSFIEAGNRAIFVIGNHDLELHWPSVQSDILQLLGLSEEHASLVRFCEWFYVSNQDTLIEHGNQYDAYCLCSNPVHPLVKKGTRVMVRLPFGNLAGKFMVNGMGLMNPHATNSYIKSSIWEYLYFYYKYMMRAQPFLVWTWFWSAFVTLMHSLVDGFLPAMKDPLTVDARIGSIAEKANASVLMVLALKEVHVHPAIFNPFKILRELWLDRAIILAMIVFGSFQFFSFLNVFAHVSLLWFFVPVALLLPGFIFYARSVQSEVDASEKAVVELAPLTARIAKVKTIVQGHTHLEGYHNFQEIEVINTGTWSPAYHDVECTQPYGRKCFVWIQKLDSGFERKTQLYEWNGVQPVLVERSG